MLNIVHLSGTELGPTFLFSSRFFFCFASLTGIDISHILTRLATSPACPTRKVLAACAKQDGILLLCLQVTASIHDEAIPRCSSDNV